MGRASRRKMAHVVSRKCVSSVCPNCTTRLDGVTAARIGGFLQQPLRLKGRPTMCSYCGALLIFADDAGNLRAMTEAERNSLNLAPEVKRIYAQWRADHPAGDFTKKRFN